MSDIDLQDYLISHLSMDVKHRCTCGERWMVANFGSVHYDEDIKNAKSLIKFVNDCKCLKKEKPKKRKKYWI